MSFVFNQVIFKQLKKWLTLKLRVNWLESYRITDFKLLLWIKLWKIQLITAFNHQGSKWKNLKDTIVDSEIVKDLEYATVPTNIDDKNRFINQTWWVSHDCFTRERRMNERVNEGGSREFPKPRGINSIVENQYLHSLRATNYNTKFADQPNSI